MSIKKQLYLAFSLVLLITLFIIGIFFYSIYTLTTIHGLQNHRYEQIRRVEKIKELNKSFEWIVLDIIVDRKKPNIVNDRKRKAEEFFREVSNIKNSVIINSETSEEKEKLKTIFEYLSFMQDFIQKDLMQMILDDSSEKELNKFNEMFKGIGRATEVLIEDETSLLQDKLNHAEQERNSFINRIKLELIFLVLISFCLAFIISSKLISGIKTMLSKLNSAILHLLSDKEQTIKIDIDQKNELSEITDNLNKYLQQKDDIIYSREELLRNISHELKTPITKGKFLIEKLKDERKSISVDEINQVFYDIEGFTNKLLEREKLNFATLNKGSFKVTTLILESLSKLSIEDESIINMEIEDDFGIYGDFYYLNIAVKNLIDNAIKYSDALPINIITKDRTLYIENKAPRLSKNIVYYLQPFTKEPNQQKGHGLGLNIVNKIIQLHSFNLNYTYKNSYNIFSINF